MADTGAALARKMVAAMGDIEAVTKSGTNQKQGYKYVKAADVANEVRSVLVKHGIAFFFSIESVERWEVPTNSGGKMLFCQLVVQCTFQDSESGEAFTVQGVGWGADSLEKAPYKAITGALKYVLRSSFLIPDEEDPENEKPELRTQSERPQSERPAVNQVPAKATETPRPGKPETPKPEPPKTETPGERTAAQKAGQNKRIRALQDASNPDKVKDYIVAQVGADYKTAPFEKWESVLIPMEAALAAGKLAEMVGA